MAGLTWAGLAQLAGHMGPGSAPLLSPIWPGPQTKQTQIPTLRWLIVSSAPGLGSECLVRMLGIHSGLPLLPQTFPTCWTPSGPGLGFSSAQLCPWFPWALPCVIPIGSAVAGDNSASSMLEMAFAVTWALAFPTLAKLAMQYNSAHLSHILCAKH